MKKMTKKSAYAQAGVDVDENELANDLIKRIIPITFDDNVVVGLEGLFSAGYRFDRDNGNFIGQKLVSIDKSSDLEKNIQNTILEIQNNGAKPLFMTDYLAFGKLKATDALILATRVMEGGRRGDGRFLPLIGGEVAEMPGVIKKGSCEIVIAITYQTDKYKKNLVDISTHDGNILTTSNDSVGTKTKLGLQLGYLDGLFQDMIGHSVGDISVQLSTPLGIAMYLGHSPHFKKNMNSSYNKSVKDSELINMSFLNHPRNIYWKGQFDIVGSIVGIVNEKKLLTGKNIREGDYLIGWKSFGVNTNGYSLIRKMGYRGEINYSEAIFPNMDVGKVLMQPHEDYRPAVVCARRRFRSYLKGAAHITGGGIEANTKRLLPEGLKISIESLPGNIIFKYLQVHGNISEEDMNKTFNRGIGVLFVVGKKYNIKNLPDNYHVVGKVIKK